MNDLEEVKTRVPWPQIFNEAGVEVIKNKARCNRHGEDKNPSINFDESKGLFYCFGCNFGSDKIGFLEWSLGIDFLTAKKLLYLMAGVPLPEYGRRIQKGKKSIHPITPEMRLYRILRLEAEVTDFEFRVKKQILQNDLLNLEDEISKIGLSKYYSRQQIIDMRLAELDNRHIYQNFKLKSKIRDYAKRYLRR